MSFLAPAFLVAGLVAACGPVIIHLLNRRRYRTVPWAAMDFLRESIQRRRRSLRLRDVLLLVLRTLAVLLLGVALARPFVSGTAVAEAQRAVHAVVLVDNSLSMGYEQLGGTLLEAAVARAKQWIDQLPAGSQVSVVPLGGAAGGKHRTTQSPRNDAADALRAITLTDRAASIPTAVDLAVEACQRLPELPVKRVLLAADRQLLGTVAQSADALRRLPGPLEMIDVGPAEAENAWIADFKMQDTLADVQTPAVFLATVRYQGSQPRRQVEVRLLVNGRVVSTTAVDLLPEQSREIRFPPYRFETAGEAGRPALVPVEVALSPDRLPQDDRRLLVVPVVAALPVVFVDQYGSQEAPTLNRYGETAALRRLLLGTASPLAPSPASAKGEGRKVEGALVQAKHVTIEQLDRATLQDARLVVMAGVRTPGGAVDVLRQYVAQGGQLIIAAGGEFDAAAWRQGAGILPVPLKPGQIGQSPDDAREPLRPFQLDVHSLVDQAFTLDQVSRDELHDLYTLPFFFRAVAAEKPAPALADPRPAAAPSEPPANWLRWAAAEGVKADDRNSTADRPADEARVVAAFTNGLPYLVERRIGRGNVLLVTSGFSPSWNTLPLTNTMVVFDRIMRGMLERTLPRRQLTTTQQHFEPLAASERMNRLALVGPQGYDESLPIEAVGAEQSGVVVGPLPMRGIYRLSSRRMAESSGSSAGSAGETPLWEIPFAVNGPAEESRLRPAAPPAATAQDDGAGVGDRTTVQAAGFGGRALWKAALIGLLVCLLVELAVLAWPSFAAPAAKEAT